MSWFPESKDHLPLTWWKQHPVYLAGVIALAGVASMIVTAVLMASAPGLLVSLVFSPSGFLDGLRVWTPLTYVLVNPPSIWLVLGCFFLWRFGEAVERHLGRRSFVYLLLALLVVQPITILILGWLGMRQAQCAGLNELEFGVFVGFAALYPRAQVSILIATVEVWILASIFIGVAALQHLAMGDWTGLCVLGACVGTAYAFIRHQQGAWQMPQFKQAQRRPKSMPPSRSEKKAAAMVNVDVILDKVSRKGLQSLTDEERRLLEKAADDLKGGRK